MFTKIAFFECVIKLKKTEPNFQNSKNKFLRYVFYVHCWTESLYMRRILHVYLLGTSDQIISNKARELFYDQDIVNK